MPTTEDQEPVERDMDACYRMAGFADEHLQRLGDIPNLDAAQNALRKFWLEDQKVITTFSEEFVGVTYATMLSEIAYSVLLADNPEKTLREKLVSSIYHLARYLVLAIPPEPLEDWTGLRLQAEGITGELSRLIPELAEACRDLPNWKLFDNSEQLDDSELHSPGFTVELDEMTRYWYARYHVLHSLSKLYESPDPTTDGWPAEVIRASCSMWEYTYRELLGMAPVQFEPIRSIVYLRGHKKLAMAAAGANDLRQAWVDAVLAITKPKP